MLRVSGIEGRCWDCPSVGMLRACGSLLSWNDEEQQQAVCAPFTSFLCHSLATVVVQSVAAVVLVLVLVLVLVMVGQGCRVEHWGLEASFVLATGIKQGRRGAACAFLFQPDIHC